MAAENLCQGLGDNFSKKRRKKLIFPRIQKDLFIFIYLMHVPCLVHAADSTSNMSTLYGNCTYSTLYQR